MGAIVNLFPTQRREKFNDFSGHTGDIGMFAIRAQDGSVVIGVLTAASPTLSNFNSFDNGEVVPYGWWLCDTITGKWYVKTGPTTWTVVGSVT
jgi:hypothetical protein